METSKSNQNKVISANLGVKNSIYRYKTRSIQ